MIVGDSYTFGAGVDFQDTFGAILQRKTPDRVVYNLGMPGFGIDQVWMSVRHQAIDLRPDLIVAGIVDADFERSLIPYREAEGFNKPTFQLVNGRLTQRTVEQPPQHSGAFPRRAFQHLGRMPQAAQSSSAGSTRSAVTLN